MNLSKVMRSLKSALFGTNHVKISIRASWKDDETPNWINEALSLNNISLTIRAKQHDQRELRLYANKTTATMNSFECLNVFCDVLQDIFITFSLVCFQEVQSIVTNKSC